MNSQLCYLGYRLSPPKKGVPQFSSSQGEKFPSPAQETQAWFISPLGIQLVGTITNIVVQGSSSLWHSQPVSWKWRGSRGKEIHFPVSHKEFVTSFFTWPHSCKEDEGEGGWMVSLQVFYSWTPHHPDLSEFPSFHHKKIPTSTMKIQGVWWLQPFQNPAPLGKKETFILGSIFLFLLFSPPFLGGGDFCCCHCCFLRQGLTV